MRWSAPSQATMVMGGAVLATWFGIHSASARALTPDAPRDDGVSFDDLRVSLKLSQSNPEAIDLSVRDGPSTFFHDLALYVSDEAERPRGVEYKLAAPGAMTGMPIDVSFSEHASISANDAGDSHRQRSGFELHIGRDLDGRWRPDSHAPEQRVYAFVASDDEALTWEPGARTAFGGARTAWALEGGRVEFGDRQVGLTYERTGMQASLVYVEREVSVTVGRTSVSRDENFAGITLTMRT